MELLNPPPQNSKDEFIIPVCPCIRDVPIDHVDWLTYVPGQIKMPLQQTDLGKVFL